MEPTFGSLLDAFKQLGWNIDAARQIIHTDPFLNELWDSFEPGRSVQLTPWMEPCPVTPGKLLALLWYAMGEYQPEFACSFCETFEARVFRRHCMVHDLKGRLQCATEIWNLFDSDLKYSIETIRSKGKQAMQSDIPSTSSGSASTTLTFPYDKVENCLLIPFPRKNRIEACGEGTEDAPLPGPPVVIGNLQLALLPGETTHQFAIRLAAARLEYAHANCFLNYYLVDNPVDGRIYEVPSP